MSSPFGAPDSTTPYIASSTCALVISVLSIALRFWSRLISQAPLGWDDWAALAALPFAVAVAGMTFGVAEEQVRMSSLQPGPQTSGLLFLFGKRFLEMNVVYDVGVTFVKLSALFFYHRVFGRGIRSFRIALQITGALCVLWLLISILLEVFMCSLFLPKWALGSTTSPVKCLNTYDLIVGISVTNVALDLVILILPHFLLYKLQMRIWQKLGLVGVFICGYSVVAMSSYRMISTIAGDAQMANQGLTVAYVLEIPIAIMSVCLPAMVQLGKRAATSGASSLFRTETGASANAPARREDIEMQKGFRKINDTSSL